MVLSSTSWVAISIHVQVFVWMQDFSSLSEYGEAGLYCHKVRVYLVVFFLMKPSRCLPKRLNLLAVAECSRCSPPQHWLLFLAVLVLTFLQCYLKDALVFASLPSVSSEHILICHQCQCVFFVHAFFGHFLVELINSSVEFSLHILDISLVSSSLADTFF